MRAAAIAGPVRAGIRALRTGGSLFVPVHGTERSGIRAEEWR